MIQVRFWGVRGSIPCPGPGTVKYGGNTACIELRFPRTGRHIIIDAGSGIRELASHMVAHDLANGPIDTSIYLTHTHWDHIMGFPFFVPAYIPGTRIRVFGPVTYEDDPLEEVVGGQMKYRYFPVNMGELAADISYHRLSQMPPTDIGDGITLTTTIINHPITALGYRFQYEGITICTAYDTEPFRNLFITDPAHPDYDELMAVEGEAAAREQNEALAAFYANADLLIHDAQYTREEYESSRIGWGHSPIEDVIESAAGAGVRRLVLFHHDPDRNDTALDEFGRRFCRHPRMHVEFAREGRILTLERQADKEKTT